MLEPELKPVMCKYWCSMCPPPENLEAVATGGTCPPPGNLEAVAGGTCPPPDNLEATAPSGTCPPLGDFAVAYWCYACYDVHDLQGF